MPINRGIVSINLNQADLWGKMRLAVGEVSFQVHLTFELYD